MEQVSEFSVEEVQVWLNENNFSEATAKSCKGMMYQCLCINKLATLC